jgi:hypothetical protein
MKLKEHMLPIAISLCSSGILYNGNAAELIGTQGRLSNTSTINNHS